MWPVLIFPGPSTWIVSIVLIHLSGNAAAAAGKGGNACPPSLTVVQESFSAEGQQWTACEDLSAPGGSIALVPKSGQTLWVPKTYEPYVQGPDSDYYLGMDKDQVLSAKWDMLGTEILEGCAANTCVTDLCEPTWVLVEKAVPVMRYSGGNKAARAGSSQEWMCSPYYPESGVRTFVGSRSASVDATFSDHADDCTDNGFPRPQSYVMNLTAIANGEPPIDDFINYINFTKMADGLVGGVLPNVVFYFPIIKQNFSGYVGSRYWTMIASPVSDMEGGREQSVWFRFQQIVCPDDSLQGSCLLHGLPQYYDTYWYSYSPITHRWIPPDTMANASGFYANLIDGMRYWNATIQAEDMMMTNLPETKSTNGTWLMQQAVHGIVKSMISRDDTWHPRYGVLPGYGVSLQDGFEDVFTNTAMAALEFGAFPYARGVIDNWLRYYVRSNGMTTYRAEELAQSGRMLSIFALYVSYTGDSDLMVEHFNKARALATWLMYRRNNSLLNYNREDPRHGIPGGGDEGDGFIAHFEKFGLSDFEHKYSCAGNIYRGFDDIGRMWVKVGHDTGRSDIAAHGEELLQVAPQLRKDINISIAKVTFTTGNPVAPRCVPAGANSNNNINGSCTENDFRGYPELFYAGVLSKDQVNDIYTTLSKSNNPLYVTRPMTLGCCGYNNKQTTYTAYGIAFGLLQHDMVERFLLHYFAMSAHTYTRGTWTTPEATSPDRDVASTDYVSAGVVTATTYLKWMLVYEEPESRTLWLGKAIPRDWLSQNSSGIHVSRATTRYGRVSFVLIPALQQASDKPTTFQISANVSLPQIFASQPPMGGLRLRLRAPLPHGGRLSSVIIGGKPWTQFDAEAETIDFPARSLTSDLLQNLHEIVAYF